MKRRLWIRRFSLLYFQFLVARLLSRQTKFFLEENLTNSPIYIFPSHCFMQNWFDRYRLRYAVLCNVRVTYVMLHVYRPTNHTDIYRDQHGAAIIWYYCPVLTMCCLKANIYVYRSCVKATIYLSPTWTKMICCYWIHVKDNVPFIIPTCIFVVLEQIHHIHGDI